MCAVALRGLSVICGDMPDPPQRAPSPPALPPRRLVDRHLLREARPIGGGVPSNLCATALPFASRLSCGYCHRSAASASRVGGAYPPPRIWRPMRRRDFRVGGVSRRPVGPWPLRSEGSPKKVTTYDFVPSSPHWLLSNVGTTTWVRALVLWTGGSGRPNPHTKRKFSMLGVGPSEGGES